MGFYDVRESAAPRSLLADRPHIPYFLPFLAFVAWMAPGQLFDHWLGVDWETLWTAYHPLVYTAQTLSAAALLAVFWKHYAPIKWRFLWLGVIIGLLGVGEWIGVAGLARWISLPFTTLPPAYDPMTHIPDQRWRYLYYVIRVGGPAIVVPLFEELFFRDFLERFFIRGIRFEEVEVGAFTWASLLGVAAVFAVNHGHLYPSGFFYGLMMGILLVTTKSLGSCIVAHGTTNFVLYLYCIQTGNWQFM